MVKVPEDLRLVFFFNSFLLLFLLLLTLFSCFSLSLHLLVVCACLKVNKKSNYNKLQCKTILSSSSRF